MGNAKHQPTASSGERGHGLIGGKLESVAIQALWHAFHEEWETAHSLVQSETSRDCAWIHGILHLKEGDLSNAQYWYDCAAQPIPQPFNYRDELNALAHHLSPP